jgi:hypothetical protein
MAKIVYYRQCHLIRQTTPVQQTSAGIIAGVREYTIRWIPEQFAVKGRVVRLRDPIGNWSDSWLVDVVWDTRLTDDELPDYHRAVKAHRKATGDSLPKHHKD